MTKNRYEGFFRGLFRRNEWMIYLSAFIFIVSIFIGYLIPGFLEQILLSTFNNMKRQISEGTLQLTTLSILLNNLKVLVILYGGGAIFGAITAFSLFFNGLFVGYAATKFPLGDFLLFTLPHGIPEILGIIIAGAAGFRLGSCVINILKGVLKIKSDMSIKGQLYYLWDESKDALFDSFILFIIAGILIVLAAFIEANFTVWWAQFIKASI